MEIRASRSKARVGPSGEPIRLFDQNRALWDQLLNRRGVPHQERARAALLLARAGACAGLGNLP